MNVLHADELIRAEDARLRELLSRQLTDESDPRYGGFWSEPFHIEPRNVGFQLGRLVAAYVEPRSEWHLGARVADAIRAALRYLDAHQRPDGCFDLSPCNFASPPDTAFMLNAILSGWWLLERCKAAEADFIREPMLRIITSAADGVAAGGFHTPNHRWAIASCLLSVYKLTGRQALKARAEEYLREGLDINADGEFAERSAGNYNQVNDDQMLRLYLATGEKRFLETAEQNLRMMYCYIDPDGSVFTNNSTRQDMGHKVYLDTYYKLYLTVGYLLHKPEFGAMAEYIYQNCRARGAYPDGLEWLQLFPDMDGYGADVPFDKPFERYDRVFEASDIARSRRGDWSYTLLRGKPNFLYFQHGAFSVYLAIYANLCDRRNIVPATLERTSEGFIMTAHAAGWYYLPFAEKPQTSDWWAMDNPRTRPKTEGMPLDTTLEIVERDDGIDLRIRTSGVDQLPMRLELGFLPGGYVRTEHFLQQAKAGGQVTVVDGMLEACSPGGECLTVGPAFAKHNVQARMGGAYPLSDSHFTVFFTDYTPVDRVVSVRAARKDRRL